MSWEMVNLGDVATFINGYPFKPTEWATEGLEIIRIQNLTKGSSETNYFKGAVPEKYKIVKGDILISWSATLDIFVWNGNDAWLNQHIFKVVFDKIEIDRQFFIYLIKHILEDMRRAVHGATMQHITKAKFDNLKVPLPPLSTQKRIAEILDAADALKRKDQELLKKYDELAQAIFIDMFGDPEKNEKGWEVKKLGEVTTIRRGASPRPIDKFIGNDVPWIKIGDGTKGGNIYIETTKVKITKAGSEKSVLLKPGSLIFANCGVSLGFARILKISGCIHDGWLSIEDIDDKILNKIFLLKYINFLTDFFRKTAPEGTQPNLNSGIMKEHKIILPPVKLQNEFSELIFALEESKIKNTETEKCGENLFQTLIQKAFKGELVK
jgi:type I restriction enzyme S subunit